MLGRSLNHLKWIALILLTGGVALVQMPAGESSKTETDSSNSFIGYSVFRPENVIFKVSPVFLQLAFLLDLLVFSLKKY